MALVAVVLWAATPIATKLAIGALDPLAVGALRTVLAAPLALGVLLLVRLRPPAGRAGRLYLLCSALGGFVVFPLLFSLGMGLTTAAHGALVLGLLPLLTGLIAAGLERRALGRRWWLASAIALAGTLLLVSERFGLAAPGASLEGDLLIILSCFAAAAGYVAGARAAREAGTWAVTFWGLLIGGLVLAPLLPWILSPAALMAAPAVVWGALVYLAGLSSIAAYGAWYWALARDDIGRTGQIQYAQPVIGVALAAVVLGETITLPLVLAGGMILLGVVLLQRVKSDPRQGGRLARAAAKGGGG
jgi:drug/metabolite transporter (DMT)-like permease